MDDDQQFCLRWNNHQSTLVSVFDNLLEKGTLVDCTLFAEGKSLNAHKVVLSACSPYFEALLTQQYDKHPIFILKDVKYQELKAMMDYMYRGEVNISQDQLAALLKAAESLQIKGLSDSRGGKEEPRKSQAPPVAKTPPPAPAPTLPRVQGLTIEQRKAPKLSDSMLEDSRSREGSTSPVPRKRKKPRRRSTEGVNDNHDASSSSESHSNQAPAVNIPPLPAASTSKLTVTDVPEPVDAKQEALRAQPPKSQDSPHPQVPIIKDQKPEIHSELILEPKAEYIEEEMNEDSVEDLTLDDDDVSQMEEMDHARPGPSHGAADGSAQGFGGWHMQGNQNQDEVFLAAQEAVGAHRDSQEIDFIALGLPADRVRYSHTFAKDDNNKYICPQCSKSYTNAPTLKRHLKYECNIEPKYKCLYCDYRTPRHYRLISHVKSRHEKIERRGRPQKGDNTKLLDSPTKFLDISLKPIDTVDITVKPVEKSTKQGQSLTKQVESTTKVIESSTKTVDVVESPTRPVQSPTKIFGSPGKEVEISCSEASISSSSIHSNNSTINLDDDK